MKCGTPPNHPQRGDYFGFMFMMMIMMMKWYFWVTGREENCDKSWHTSTPVAHTEYALVYNTGLTTTREAFLLLRLRLLFGLICIFNQVRLEFYKLFAALCFDWANEIRIFGLQQRMKWGGGERRTDGSKWDTTNNDMGGGRSVGHLVRGMTNWIWHFRMAHWMLHIVFSCHSLKTGLDRDEFVGGEH